MLKFFEQFEAKITAIINQSTGRKLQIAYGNVTASNNPAQIAEVQNWRGDVMAKRMREFYPTR